ncbi:hypothetical protein TFUB20_02179 [Tannerella forsythia]|uniref:Uncharacterized protein n=1 Tax=Tannerella forsythia TaxID=28112 RepID=A0A1D3UUF5_TANFO|nr:hypothetical protein TFUB20_02179 [Tannerella forsythia]
MTIARTNPQVSSLLYKSLHYKNLKGRRERGILKYSLSLHHFHSGLTNYLTVYCLFLLPSKNDEIDRILL